jgi:hypothetical protein
LRALAVVRGGHWPKLRAARLLVRPVGDVGPGRSLASLRPFPVVDPPGRCSRFVSARTAPAPNAVRRPSVAVTGPGRGPSVVPARLRTSAAPIRRRAEDARAPAAFERCSAHFVHQVEVTDPGSCSRSTRRVPAWQLTYGDRSGYLPIAVLFAGASDWVLRNHMRAMRELVRSAGRATPGSGIHRLPVRDRDGGHLPGVAPAARTARAGATGGPG